MVISFGSENGIPTPLSSPQEFVPIHQMSLQWPMWGQYAETNGNSGQPVDMPQAEKLLELYDQWQLAQSREQKVAAWQQILDLPATQIYPIGIIAQVTQPVVVANTPRNEPRGSGERGVGKRGCRRWA